MYIVLINLSMARAHDQNFASSGPGPSGARICPVGVETLPTVRHMRSRWPQLVLRLSRLGARAPAYDHNVCYGH